jgi:4-carboxymuconolactone decarboxylase
MSEQTMETPVLDLLSKMTADSLEATDLDAKTLLLVRIAALVAIDAPPASYLMNLGAADELGITEDEVRAVFMAVAQIVGTARVASAMGKVVRALGLAIELSELDETEV